MQRSSKIAKIGVVVLALASTAGCAGTGGLGSVLGSVLGGGGQQQASQVSGQVAGVDTRNQQIGLRQSNGQVVAVSYDQNTQVVYQNQSYPITALENGDQVTLRLQQTNNGGYYTDMVQVDQSVRGSSSVGYPQGNVSSFVGTVRSVARQQGFFSLTMQNGAVVTVQLPSQVNRNDLSRFNSLRAGDYVQFYGVNMGNNNIELRQFQ